MKVQIKKIIRALLLCLLALQQTTPAHGSRILAAFIFPCKSHFMMTNAIVRELLNRGHEVTFITPFSLASENLGKNYTEILIPKYEFWPQIKAKTNTKTILDMADVPTLKFWNIFSTMGIKATDFALALPEIKAIINEKHKSDKYDLLITEQFYNEPALIFGQLYEIPIVTISTFSYANYMSQLFGIISPWSYVPHGFLPFTDHMSFTERIANVLTSAAEDLYRKYSYIPAMDYVLQKHFSHLPEGAPTVAQLERNISILLLNSYMPLATARPTAFNIIQCGGLHILPPKPLPAHIAKFLNEAEDGVIYFSLGSQIRSADMPVEKRQIFLNVFGSLKQRVLWKFEDEKLPNLPENVMVQAWTPQGDILAHRKVKVFITHGGQFGTQEALHYGIPMLGMPVYSDQHLNVNQGKAAGYALSLDYRTLTAESLRASLVELLENPKYKINIERASRIFRDRPLSAMDTAMYWIDYVIEHRGAPHLVAAGLDLPWYQFYLLDVIVAGLFIIFLLSRVYVIVAKCFSIIKKINKKKIQ